MVPNLGRRAIDLEVLRLHLKIHHRPRQRVSGALVFRHCGDTAALLEIS